MITADQLLAHAVGDYLLQSHWMAVRKLDWWLPAAIHAGLYLLPFVLITRSPLALCVMGGTHFVIDRWRLARYVVWFKNYWGSPAEGGERYSTLQPTATGYPESVPAWLATWLLIIADNVLHVSINGLAICVWG